MKTCKTHKEIEFLAGRGSRFQFECKACGRCCGEYMIMLSPYDIIRLRRATGHSTTELVQLGTVHIRRMPFKKVFGFGPVADMLDMFDLSQADMLPVAFMEFDTEDSGRQACRFLSPDEGGKRLCSIYEHRPGMCRLHPLGCVTIGGRRKWIYRQPLCESNKGPEQTVEEWLRASRMKPFLAANARYLRWMRKLFEEREKFLSIPEDKWQMLEHILYNFDSINRGAAKTNMDAIEEKFYRWLYQALPDKT